MHRTKQYIPNPIRCANCQRYGHPAKVCRSYPRCPRCSGSHTFQNCPDKNSTEFTPRCVNCNEDHSAAYKGCTAYSNAKSISEIKISEGISYAAAINRFRAQAQPHTNVRRPSQSDAFMMHYDPPPHDDSMTTVGGYVISADSNTLVYAPPQVTTCPQSHQSTPQRRRRQPIVVASSNLPTKQSNVPCIAISNPSTPIRIQRLETATSNFPCLPSKPPIPHHFQNNEQFVSTIIGPLLDLLKAIFSWVDPSVFDRIKSLLLLSSASTNQKTHNGR
jgi:hypothetical protein